MINFFKYQGTGNDFIMLDNLSNSFKADKVEFARRWCDRHFGVGSDGMIFLEKSANSDFKMDFYNPDGSQSFCGNGSRCAVQFALQLGIVNPDKEISFEAIDGLHIAQIQNDLVSVQMKNVDGVRMVGSDFFIHTGSPHYISFDEQKEKNLIEFGRRIRYSDAYKPGGTNVNLVSTLERNHIQVATYERGVEDETFSCGTGVTAAALAYAFKNDLSQGVVTIEVKGGTLHVNFEKHENGYHNIWLKGPAQIVYQGVIHDHII